MSPRLAPLLFAALTMAACGREQSSSTASPSPPVILISVDTLRADHLPMYGYAGVATPAIDALRKDSILFSAAYSPCPLTLPAHVSMLTGLEPPAHGVRNNAGYTFDGKKHSSLPVRLREKGYRTGAAVSSYVLRKETGIGPLFEAYDDAIPIRSEAGSFVQHQRSGEVSAESAWRWIEQHAGGPFFYFLHLYEPHTPYAPPEPYRSRYASPYDGEIAHADAIVGRFLSRLRSSGVYDRALIIFTSDHGEGLGDHGEAQHGILLYRETVQVPLLIKLPRSERGGEMVAAPAALIDLAPTILHATRSQADPALPGKSLLGRDLAERQIYSESYFPFLNLGWSPLRSLRTATHSFIEAPSLELYNLRQDPQETRNIAQEERRTLSAFRTRMNSYPRDLQQADAVDAETARQLAALGYLGSTKNRDLSAALMNPREGVELLPAIGEAFELADKRAYVEAIERMRELIRRNPRMLDVREKLALTLAEAGRDEEAIAAFQEAMRQSPETAPGLALRIADLYLRNGRLADAEAHARLGLQADPLQAHTLLARAAAERGDFAAAQAEVDHALRAGQQQPATFILLAEIQTRQEKFPPALASIGLAEQRAAELKIERVHRLELARGDVLARMGRNEEAITAYRKEIEFFPDSLHAYARLAVLHALRGDGPAFDATLGQMIRANPTRRARELAAKTAEAVGDRAGRDRWLRPPS